MKRLIATIIICSLFMNIIILNIYTDNKETQKLNEKTVQITKSENGNATATTNFDGSILKATYEKDSDTYRLYRDNIEYNVNVSKYDQNIVIDVEFDNPKVIQSKDLVIAQDAYVISQFLWGAATIAAAMQVISALIVCAAVAGAVVVTWYAVDTIAQAIAKTEAKVKTNPKTQKPSAYYMAGLVAGKVVIGKPINYAIAVATLKAGLDVFATNYNAAYSVALSASKIPLTPKWEPQHKIEEGYYPHWHPAGVKSLKASSGFTRWPNAAPHCWYPA